MLAWAGAGAGAGWVHLTSAGRKDRKGISIFSHCVVRSRCSASAERAGQKMLGWYSCGGGTRVR